MPPTKDQEAIAQILWDAGVREVLDVRIGMANAILEKGFGRVLKPLAIPTDMALTPYERRRALRTALVKKALWPDDFEWDFNIAGSDAIGLARKTGIITNADSRSVEAMGLAFGLSVEEVCRTFVSATIYETRSDMVTPGMVAARLDALEHAKENPASGIATSGV